MLFDELIPVYIEYAKNNKTSWKRDMTVLKYIEPFFKNRRLREITPDTAEQYRSKRMKYRKSNGETLSPATINREIEVLRKMFTIAVNNGWVDENPCLARKLRPLTVNNIKERYLELNEEARLLAACTGQYEHMRPIIICALHTGMRKGEILNLRWDCVDFAKRHITLLKTKNGKKRNVPISSTLLNEFKTLKENAQTEYVFGNSDTGKPYADLKRPFPQLCKIANIENFTFHQLRHTATTRMFALGLDSVTIMDIVGHADLKTTMRYAHPITERKLQAVEALDNYSKLAVLN
jgi:integrase